MSLVGDDQDSDTDTDVEILEAGATKKLAATFYLEQIFSKKFEAVWSLIKRLMCVKALIRRCVDDPYAGTPFSD